MIYTVTFNPSLDYIMHVDSFKEGQTNRSSKEEMYPGGKGINVSMILNRLGVPTTALGFVAGFTGSEIEQQLHHRGLMCDLCYLNEGISRINIKMKGQQETEINGSGPHISGDKLEELFSKIDKINQEDWLVLAGSIPNSLPTNIYEQIMQRCQNKGIHIVVDATKELLLNVLPYHPFLIKPNLNELEALFDDVIDSKEKLIHYAKQLQQLGAKNVLVSLGKDGAILISEQRRIYYCKAAKGKLLNSVGSGDSMVAGFIAGYQQTKDYKKALHLGSACGGATAFSEDLATYDLIQKVALQIEVQNI